MNNWQWRFPAQCIKVIDGDTIEVYVDLGMMKYERTRVRLLGVDCPEMRGEDKTRGIAAKVFVEAWMVNQENKWPLVIETSKDDSFGRWLARVYDSDGKCLNDDLVEAGMVK